MYCQTCGNKLSQALSYCNHCGADLRTLKNQAETPSIGTSIDTIMWVIVGMTITLLGMALGAMVLIQDGTIDAGLGRAFVFLSLLAFVVVDGVLIWRLVNLHKLSNEKRSAESAKNSDPAELNKAKTRALRDPGEPVPTVTEQTTRNLEPSYREK